MNKQESDILQIIFTEKYTNQRFLSEESGHSLGVVNRSLKTLYKNGYIDKFNKPTEKAIGEILANKPKQAIILAAGFGMRMVPINQELPKGLIEVNGEPLIERLIKQLHAVGIKQIDVVVGFMKERYEYLIDEYDVNLIINPDYSIKNNLFSLSLARNNIFNAYIIPCDIWCEENPFSEYEMYSWYMVSNALDNESELRVNRNNELVKVPKHSNGNKIIGICYLSYADAKKVSRIISDYAGLNSYKDAFWEECLYNKDRLIVKARLVDDEKFIEINTYEQLRELDSGSNHLKHDAIDVIARTLDVDSSLITNITVLKKGMTNRSFLFSVKDKKYIMRVPGEGTDQLINRKNEASVYDVISGTGTSDKVIYINPDNGYKITEFLEGARSCDLTSQEDLKKCLEKLKKFHQLSLTVEHDFDLFEQIDLYESLWGGIPSIYKDYEKTKKKVLSLKSYIDKQNIKKVLSHIDSVPDNFLFVSKSGKEDVYLIDWEYAGMQDPHIDLAMFCLYALYNLEEVNNLIDLYFTEGCPKEVRIKIYAYISIGGLLWSNWCEYKRHLGVDFGEYSLRQYRYAKDYYKIVQEELANESR